MNEEEIISGEELLKVKQEERKIRKTKKQISFLKKTLKFLIGVSIIFGIGACSMMKGWYFPQLFLNSIQIGYILPIIILSKFLH